MDDVLLPRSWISLTVLEKIAYLIESAGTRQSPENLGPGAPYIWQFSDCFYLHTWALVELRICGIQDLINKQIFLYIYIYIIYNKYSRTSGIHQLCIYILIISVLIPVLLGDKNIVPFESTMDFRHWAENAYNTNLSLKVNVPLCM